jgi:hypothetical protein
MIVLFSSSYLLLQAVIVILPSPKPKNVVMPLPVRTYRLVTAHTATFLHLEF